jgi:nucleoside-diphosphate-sugar epimerase
VTVFAVTGANGKLGSALVEHYAGLHQVHAIARDMPTGLSANARGYAVGPLSGMTDFSEALSGVDAVVHCAALTWVDPATGTEAAFQTVNVDATQRLGEQAAAAGCKRIVYVSSLTVNGKHSDKRPFRADDVPAPESAYSKSKFEAEQVLRAIAEKSDLEVVVIRPPRIVWPDLTGNLAMMAKLISRGIPLPFGMLTRNARDNLSSQKLLSELVRHSVEREAVGKTILLTDGKPMSTKELAIWLGERVGRKPILLPVPESILRLIVNSMPQRLLGKLNRKELLDELTRDLVVQN